VAPFRVFGIAARPLASPPPAVLFWNWLLVQSFPPKQVSPAWVGRFHYAVGHILGCVAFPESTPPVTVKHPTDPLFEFHLPLEYYSTKPSRPTAVSQLLSWTFAPFSTCKRRRSTWCGLCLPAWLRLQGLVTLLTPYSLRRRAGFVSHRRRSWDSPFGAFPSRKGIQAVSDPDQPTCRSNLRVLPLPKQQAGLADPRLLGFDPSESPLSKRACLARETTGCSLGFRPSRVLQREPWPGLRPASSYVLGPADRKRPSVPAP